MRSRYQICRRPACHLTVEPLEDRLVFDLQTAVAESFGYSSESPDGTGLPVRASEALMRRYYWAAKAVAQPDTRPPPLQGTRTMSSGMPSAFAWRDSSRPIVPWPAMMSGSSNGRTSTAFRSTTMGAATASALAASCLAANWPCLRKSAESSDNTGVASAEFRGGRAGKPATVE